MTEMNSVAVSLDAFLPVETAELHVKTPVGKATGWKIQFNGPATEKAQAYIRARSRRDRERTERLEALRLNGRRVTQEDVAGVTEDAQQKDNLAWFASRIASWSPKEVNVRGEIYLCTPEGIAALFGRPDMLWAYNEVVTFLGGEASFTRPSETT